MRNPCGESYRAWVEPRGRDSGVSLSSGNYECSYLQRGNQNEFLRTYCEKYYPAAKNDLATVFVERCIQFCSTNGSTALVAPQNWLFLVTYKKMREKLLREEVWNLIARLGVGAFETISGPCG